MEKQVADEVIKIIKAYWHKYSDDVGAHFANNLHEQNGLEGFLQRFALEGYKVKLSEMERDCLVKAGRQANIYNAAKDARLAGNLIKMFTWKRSSYMALLAVCAYIAFQFDKKSEARLTDIDRQIQVMDQAIAESYSIIKYHATEEAKLVLLEGITSNAEGRAGLAHERKMLLEQIEGNKKNEGIIGDIQEIATDGKYQSFRIAFGLLMSLWAMMGLNAFNTSQSKYSQIVASLTEFADHELCRTPLSAIQAQTR